MALASNLNIPKDLAYAAMRSKKSQKKVKVPVEKTEHKNNTWSFKGAVNESKSEKSKKLGQALTDADRRKKLWNNGKQVLGEPGKVRGL